MILERKLFIAEKRKMVDAETNNRSSIDSRRLKKEREFEGGKPTNTGEIDVRKEEEKSLREKQNSESLEGLVIKKGSTGSSKLLKNINFKNCLTPEGSIKSLWLSEIIIPNGCAFAYFPSLFEEFAQRELEELMTLVGKTLGRFLIITRDSIYGITEQLQKLYQREECPNYAQDCFFASDLECEFFNQIWGGDNIERTEEMKKYSGQISSKGVVLCLEEYLFEEKRRWGVFESKNFL